MLRLLIKMVRYLPYNYNNMIIRLPCMLIGSCRTLLRTAMNTVEAATTDVAVQKRWIIITKIQFCVLNTPISKNEFPSTISNSFMVPRRSSQRIPLRCISQALHEAAIPRRCGARPSLDTTSCGYISTIHNDHGVMQIFWKAARNAQTLRWRNQILRRTDHKPPNPNQALIPTCMETHQKLRGKEPQTPTPTRLYGGMLMVVVCHALIVRRLRFRCWRCATRALTLSVSILNRL